MAVATLVFSAIVAFAIYKLAWRYHLLKRNVALAKSSGLPVIVTPWNVYNRFWLATYKLWTPLFRTCLPRRLQGLWIEYVWAMMPGFPFLISLLQCHAARMGLHDWTQAV